MGDNIRITVIATGFDRAKPLQEAEQPFFRAAVNQRPAENPATHSEQKQERTQTVQTPHQEQNVYTGEVDVDVPTFLRRNRNR